MLSTLIIEDEKSSQNLLKQLIEEYCPELDVKGICSSKAESISLIHKIKPDLVFMDINLNDCLAFDILELIDHTEFKIIFTTAHEEHALQAFKFEAIDYLLKPYSPRDIIAAVQRVKKQEYPKSLLNQLQEIIKPNESGTSRQKIRVNSADGIYFYKPDDIIRIEANGSYAMIHSIRGKSNLVSKNLKEFERILSPAIFIRTHTSHLVNIQKIKAFKKEDGGFLVMSDESKIPVSRRKKASLLDLLEGKVEHV